MIRLLIVLAVLASTVWLAKYSFADTDYVVIGYGPWVIRMSFTVFVAALLLLCVPAYIGVRLIGGLLRSPRTLRTWRESRKYRDAHEALSEGLTAAAEGRWRAAERQLVHAARHGASPALGYIAAARAAHALGETRQRDQYLLLASRGQPASHIAVGITQAELQLGEAQRESALATLLQLRARAPGNKHVLELLRSLYQDLDDWKALLDLLPALRQHGAWDSEELEALEREALARLLVRASASGDLARLKWQWDAVPKAKRTHPRLLGVYAELSLTHGAGAELEPLLREALNREWDAKLVYLYGRVRAPDPGKQLRNAEAWLKARQGDAILLLTLGRICVSNRLWGKARSYLEASIAIEPHVEAYGVLAELLGELGEADEAASLAKTGLALAVAEHPAFPRVDTPRKALEAERPRAAPQVGKEATPAVPALPLASQAGGGGGA